MNLGSQLKIKEQINIFLALTKAITCIKPFLAKSKHYNQKNLRRHSARPAPGPLRTRAFRRAPADVRAPSRSAAGRGGACKTVVVAAAMAAASGSVPLQRCMVSPAGRHSASLIFLHGSGGLQFYALVFCSLGNILPSVPAGLPQWKRTSCPNSAR